MHIELFKNAHLNPSKLAIVTPESSFTYKDLTEKAAVTATLLLAEKQDLEEARIAFMVSPGFDYVSTQWGIWQAGGIAVPLCITYPLPSLQYVIEDTQSNTIVVSKIFVDILKEYCTNHNIRFIVVEDIIAQDTKSLPQLNLDRKAMILYTSGTTSLPKGVVTTHKNIQAQIKSLVLAWAWTNTDYILCVLPLHHIHGIINVISCALWSGATVEFLPNFSAKAVFDVFALGKVNVFMAVPTIYFKLIQYYDEASDDEKERLYQMLSTFRLMVSGSAALPVSVMEKWKIVSGHTLLERYGMTEIGMGISNPYTGARKAGYIGMALPGVQVRLVNEQQEIVAEGTSGEIQIKGDNVFVAYWQKPEATTQAFTHDGWFKTGDIAQCDDGYIKILGRDSIDIIKSGGYKISALEIEEVLRSHSNIIDCSVIGIPNEEWGELVAAVILVKTLSIDLKALNLWMREQMPAYKTPRLYKIINELPRNAMGKVTKNDLKSLFNESTI
jgi:malonyl-CoA/methylmalonyl-CoA synthetase